MSRRDRMARIEDIEAAAKAGKTAVLRCPVCWERYSADPGDYFWARPRHAFRCTCTRGRPGLRLEVKP